MVSRSAWDDGAPSFPAEGALKVRVGPRPTSLIPAGFCHLVQEDKWTFDTNTRPILLKTKMFAARSCGRCRDAAGLRRLRKGKSLMEREQCFPDVFSSLCSKQKL